MKVESASITVNTRGDVEVINITEEVQKRVSDSKVSEGTVTVFCPGSTGAVTTLEYEPGLLRDIPDALERIAPRDHPYEHHGTWGCDNGRSHVRATLLGPSLVVPFSGGKLELGIWQQIVFIELDTRGRERKIILKIMGA